MQFLVNERAPPSLRKEKFEITFFQHTVSQESD